jgi:hypothetical protein
MIKLKALSDSLLKIVIAGKEYIVNEENCIEVELVHLETALTHGFEVFVEKVKGKK